MFRPTVAQTSELRKDLSTALVLLKASSHKPTVKEFLQLKPLPPGLAHLEPMFCKLTLEQFFIFWVTVNELESTEAQQ
jgi:hypothetical protein